MPFQPSDTIPDFETFDVRGNPVSTRALRGRAWLLSFFRFSTCAMCNLRVHELLRRYPRYRDAGREVVAVFESAAANVVANVGKQGVPFPLIADPRAVLYDLFGVETSESKVLASMNREDLKPKIEAAAAIGYPLKKEEGANFYRMPADFLIGPDGRFLAAFYAETVGEHLSFDTVDAFLLPEAAEAVR